MAPFNPNGVDCGRLWAEGPEYAHANFPKLTFIEQCKVVERNGRKKGRRIVSVENLKPLHVEIQKVIIIISVEHPPYIVFQLISFFLSD
jgi:hypothetical protein